MSNLFYTVIVLQRYSNFKT